MRKMYATDGLLIYKYDERFDGYEPVKDKEVVDILNHYYEKNLAWEQRGIKREGQRFNTEELLIDTIREKDIWLDVLLYDLGFAYNYGHARALVKQGKVYLNGLKADPDLSTIPVGEVVHQDITIKVGDARSVILSLDKSYDPDNKTKLKIIIIKREEILKT